MTEKVCGLHAVTALLEGDAEAITELWVQRTRKDRRLERLLGLARRRVGVVHEVERADLDRLVPGVRHQGVVALARGGHMRGEPDIGPLLDAAGPAPLVLVLDGIQDPHNLGACLRTADGAGVTLVVAPRDRAVGLTAAVRKVACGGAETVPFIQVANLARTLRLLAERGLKIVGLEGMAAAPLSDCDLRGPLVLVMGGEEKGLRHLTREHCSEFAAIPLKGTVESLNVSVAAGIALFEAVRQRDGDTLGE